MKIWRLNVLTKNFAGVNRDVIHIEFMTTQKNIGWISETNQKLDYDWSTGLLLKNEFQRTLLDVSGKTNSDKVVQEISKVNFPKNGGVVS